MRATIRTNLVHLQPLSFYPFVHIIFKLLASLWLSSICILKHLEVIQVNHRVKYNHNGPYWKR